MEWSGQPFFKLFFNCHMLSEHPSITFFPSPAAGFAFSSVYFSAFSPCPNEQSGRLYFGVWSPHVITFVSEWMSRKVSHCVCRQRSVFEGAWPQCSAPLVFATSKHRFFMGGEICGACDAQTASLGATAYICWPKLCRSPDTWRAPS